MRIKSIIDLALKSHTSILVKSALRTKESSLRVLAKVGTAESRNLCIAGEARAGITLGTSHASLTTATNATGSGKEEHCAAHLDADWIVRVRIC